MSFLKVVYILAVGVFVVLFLAFGIAAFYGEPKPPPYSPPSGSYLLPPASPKLIPLPEPATPTPEEVRREQEYQEEYDKARQAYEQARKSYDRNAFSLLTVLGVAAIVLGLLLRAGPEAIRSGLVLGGTLTVFYGIARFFGDFSEVYRFVAAAVGLGILLFLGYRAFSERKPPPAP